METKNKKLVYSLITMSFALILINAWKKDGNNNPVIPATVTDIDGNVYHTIKMLFFLVLMPKKITIMKAILI